MNWDESRQTCVFIKEVVAAQQKCPAESNPVLVLTGAKREYVSTGLALAGIELTLTYDTTSKVAGPLAPMLEDIPALGALWKSSFHRRVIFGSLSPSSATVLRGDGSPLYFEVTNGSWTPVANIPYRFAAISGGYILSELATGNVERFDASGQLQSISTGTGNQLTFSYDAQSRPVQVQSSEGRTLRFVYSDGRVSRITGPDWQTVDAGYDASGNLTSLTWADGKVFGFRYQHPGLPWALTGKVDENGSDYATFDYDSTGRAILSTHAGGNDLYRFTYNSTPTLVLVNEDFNPSTRTLTRYFEWRGPSDVVMTTPGNQSITFSGIPKGPDRAAVPLLTSRSQPAGSGCSASTRAQEFDAAGNLIWRDDFDGTRTCFTYEGNREVKRIEGLPAGAGCPSSPPAGARMVTTVWHSDWNLPTLIAEPLRQTTFVYQGQPGAPADCAATAARPDGKPAPLLCKREERALLSPNGALDPSVEPRIEEFKYDSLGRVKTRIDANGNTTSFDYYTDTSLFDATGVDANIANVTLLIRGDGANGSTFIRNAAPSASSVVAVGDAKISTAQGKFASSSISFDGAGDFLLVPNGPDWDFGNGDFTIETWIYKNAESAQGSRIWNPNGDSYDGIALNLDASGNFGVSVSTTGNAWAYSMPAVANLANGQWYHVAAVRNGGSVFAFVNGTRYVVTTALGTTALFASPWDRAIGGQAPAVGIDRALNGFIDDFRITKGLARYTANFTPPTAPHPDRGPGINSAGHTVGDLMKVTKVVNGTQQVVAEYTAYDPAGRVLQFKDGKGVTTDIRYTARGWEDTVQVKPDGGAARTTRYFYDNVGQRTRVVMPDETSMTFNYDDAHRLTGIVDAQGNAITYTLDGSGNRVGEDIRDAGGTLRRTITRSFDALNRMERVSTAMLAGRVGSTLTLAASPNPTAPNQPVTLTAQVAGNNPTGTITFYDGSKPVASGALSGGSVSRTTSFADVGPHSLTAEYSGDSLNTSSVSAANTLTVLSPTATTLSIAPNPVVAGNPVTLTARISGTAPSGSVTFMAGSTVLGSATVTDGTGILNRSINAGTYQVTAVYAGDATNSPSTSPAVSLTVKTTVNMTWFASPNPAVKNVPATLTANVFGSSPTGTVTFLDGSTPIGSAPVSGSAANLLYAFPTSGLRSIKANYSGDTNNAPGSVAFALNVLDKTPATASLTISPTSTTIGSDVTLTATVTGNNPTGSVTWQISNSSWCDGFNCYGSAPILVTRSLGANSTATLTGHLRLPGSASVFATYNGDTNNASATSSTKTFTASKISSTIDGSCQQLSPGFVSCSSTVQIEQADTAFTCNSTHPILQVLEGATIRASGDACTQGSMGTVMYGTLTFSGVPAGTHTYTLKFLGTSTIQSSSTTATVVVQ